MAVSSWWFAVGGPAGLSLTKNKKKRVLKDSPAPPPCPTREGPLCVPTPERRSPSRAALWEAPWRQGPAVVRMHEIGIEVVAERVAPGLPTPPSSPFPCPRRPLGPCRRLPDSGRAAAPGGRCGLRWLPAPSAAAPVPRGSAAALAEVLQKNVVRVGLGLRLRCKKAEGGRDGVAAAAPLGQRLRVPCSRTNGQRNVARQTANFSTRKGPFSAPRSWGRDALAMGRTEHGEGQGEGCHAPPLGKWPANWICQGPAAAGQLGKVPPLPV